MGNESWQTVGTQDVQGNACGPNYWETQYEHVSRT